MIARQLVDRKQGRRHRQPGAVSQQMRRQMGRQGGQHVGRDCARGDRKTGPCQYRCGDQQRVIVRALVLDAAGFADCFGRFHQGIIGVQIAREQMVQRMVDRILMIRFQQLVHGGVQAALPAAFFQAAGGLDRGLCERSQTLAVGGKFGRCRFGRTTHGGEMVEEDSYCSGFDSVSGDWMPVRAQRGDFLGARLTRGHIAASGKCSARYGAPCQLWAVDCSP